MNQTAKVSGRGVTFGVIGIALLVITAIAVPNLIETLDAKEVMVIQSVTGELTVYTDPGPKWQGFGKVTTYPRRDQYSFSSAKDQGSEIDLSIKTGFNDGGTGRVSGVMSWEMPLKIDQVIRLHKEYGSFTAIEQQLIRPMLEKVIFSAGATMSSIESSSERRPEIPQTIDDQLKNGPFLTNVQVQTVVDQMTKQEKTLKTVQISVDKNGVPIRASASTIVEYGIALSPVTINDIAYENSVRDQIAERQKSTQAVQLSQAAAIRATQDTITTEQQGKATAAKAKWDQETVKAKEVTLAQQKFEVATLAAKEAEQYKRQQILIGEGNATKQRLEMQANGALEQKLAAYVAVNAKYAEAIGKYTGAWVPTTVMGGNGNGTTNGAQTLIELLSVKTARDLNLDMGIKR